MHLVLLSEARGKDLLAEFQVAVPPGTEVRERTQLDGYDLGFPCAVKAQVRSGGRGKAGGVRRCDDLHELRVAFDEIMAAEFAGELPGSCLVEPWLPIARELYLSVTVDGAADGYVVLYAPEGGADVEGGAPPARYEVGAPEAFRGHELRRGLEQVEHDRSVREQVVPLARRLLAIAVAADCLTVEVNPLVVLDDGSILAADAKVVLDAAAATRHARTAQAAAEERARQSRDVRRCQEANLMLIWLDGDVGLVSGGAGMTMAAMDAVDAAGSATACFLDVSGNPTPKGLGLALSLLDESPQVKTILVSMFGGGLRVDRVAKNLLELLGDRPAAKPVVFRLDGTGSEDATRLLADAGYRNHATLESAVQEIVSALQPEPVAP
jgi:succinyl-CoA synthetase beta subunit